MTASGVDVPAVRPARLKDCWRARFTRALSFCKVISLPVQEIALPGQSWHVCGLLQPVACRLSSCMGSRRLGAKLKPPLSRRAPASRLIRSEAF
jgi:hypothetical protein